MATKKFDRTVWHGTDCDKVTSLFEYGLLVRYITKEKSWQCIYRNPHESNKFSYSWISEEDMREMFLTGWAKDDLKSFCSYVGDTWNDWLQLTQYFPNKDSEYYEAAYVRYNAYDSPTEVYSGFGETEVESRAMLLFDLLEKKILTPDGLNLKEVDRRKEYENEFE